MPNWNAHRNSCSSTKTETRYDGVETLDKKMERIMGEKFTEKMEDSE